MIETKQQYCVILIFLVINLTQSQTYSKTKVINLQQNEYIVQELSELYDFTAKSITWPTNFPSAQINLPYQALSDIKGTQQSTIELASFLDGNAKYTIGLNFQLKDTNSTDIILSYIRIQIDPKTKIIRREELSNKKVDTQQGVISPYYYGSLYTKTNGFVSYYIVDEILNKFYKKVLQFNYHDKSGLSYTVIPNIDLFTHASILGPDSVVYLIQYRFEQFQLYKYNNTEIDLIDLTRSYVDTNINRYFIDSGKYYIAFNLQNSTMYYSTVDFHRQKLAVREVVIPIKFGPECQVIGQRLNNTLIIAISDLVQMSFIKMQPIDFLNYGTLKILSYDVIPLILPQKSFLTFINTNSFIFIDGLHIQLVDIAKSKIIYTQAIEDTMKFLQLDFYQNQVMLFLRNEEKTKVTYLQRQVVFYSPSLVIYGKQQTLNLTIASSQFPFSLNIMITVNIPSSNQVTFSQQKILFSQVLTLLPLSTQNLPVESFVTGVDLQLNVSAAESSTSLLKNVKFIKQQQLKTVQKFAKDESFKSYQTDYYFASLIQKKVGDNYQILALAPIQIIDGTGGFDQFKCDMEFKSEIDIIDNAGSFILQEDQQANLKTIQVIFIQQNQLIVNQIKIQCDSSSQQFMFSSDPFYNIIFIACGVQLQAIHYLPTGVNGDLAKITLQEILIINPSSFSQIICMRGILFLSNETQISAFDYINMAYFSEVISIPKLSDKQQKIVLYKHSFLIFIIDQPLTVVKQYSYNGFKTQQPIFLRNLQIDNNYVVNPIMNIISMRNDIEYILIETMQEQQYLVYRISPKAYSQNQLYTIVQINTQNGNIPVMNASLYCIISDEVNCTQILQSASIQYNLSITEEQFITNLQFTGQIFLSNGVFQQEYDIVIQRNAESKNMIINQLSDTVQILKAKFQDTIWNSKTQFKLDDQKIMNTCIIGWESSQDECQIANRITFTNVSDNGIKAFPILYNQKVIVTSNQVNIMNTLILQENYQSCIVLDDAGSVTNYNLSTFEMDLYILCSKYLVKYKLQVTKDDKLILSTKQLNKQIFNTRFIYDVEIYSKILSFNNLIIIFSFNGDKLDLIFDYNNLQYYIDPNPLQYISQISLNVIYSLNQKIQLTFFQNGVIYFQIFESPIPNQYVNIKDKLIYSNYFIDSCDSINAVDQYSDTEFRISFSNTYIYDITFYLTSDSILSISSVSLFYYKDSFSKLLSGFKGSQYLLFYGQLNTDYIITLYSNKNSKQNQFLIESNLILPFSTDNIGIRNMEEKGRNQIIISFSNDITYSFEIQQKIGLFVSQQKSQIPLKGIQILPKKQQNPLNVISLTIKQNPPDPPYNSHNKIHLYYIKLFVFTNIIFFL